MPQWEKIAESTYRLELEDGDCLYRVIDGHGAQMVYAPSYSLVRAIKDIKEIIDGATYHLDGTTNARALRVAEWDKL
jgi:hypothetical protein